MFTRLVGLVVLRVFTVVRLGAVASSLRLLGDRRCLIPITTSYSGFRKLSGLQQKAKGFHPLRKEISPVVHAKDLGQNHKIRKFSPWASHASSRHSIPLLYGLNQTLSA